MRIFIIDGTLAVVTLIVGSGLGITAGAHRLWSHKAYKATWQLRLLLTFLFTISGQVSWNAPHNFSFLIGQPFDNMF